MPTERSPINEAVQKAQTILMTASNIMVLGMSTLTSLLDPVGIAVRTGEPAIALNALKSGLAESLRKNKGELTKLGETLGLISDTAIKDVFNEGYSGRYMTGKTKKVNDKFFELIQLERWTKSTRLMGLAAAQDFIKKHVGGSNPNSKRFLEELGLQKGDVKLGSDGSIKVLTYSQRNKANKADKARDQRVRYAITNFVDSAILRPTPSQRPLWASDPHYALFFHLKSFMYSFHKTIIMPAINEAVKHGNAKPLIALGMYPALMMAVNAAKDVVKTMGDDDEDWTPDYKANWGVGQYMWDGIERSGVLGLGQLPFDMSRSSEFGDSAIFGLFGPALDYQTFTKLPVPLNYWYKNLNE